MDIRGLPFQDIIVRPADQGRDPGSYVKAENSQENVERGLEVEVVLDGP
jgi:hypothetical protein